MSGSRTAAGGGKARWLVGLAVVALIAVGVFIVTSFVGSEPVEAEAEDYENPELLAETDWLAERMGDEDLVIIDARSEKEGYDEGHIPGALYMEYKKTKGENGVNIVNTQEAEDLFAKEYGIDEDDTVVVYDDVGSYSGRVWWTIYHYGHDDVRWLNGGYDKWVEEGRDTTREVPGDPEPGDFKPEPIDDMATADDVSAAIDNPSVQIRDTRSFGEYYGLMKEADRRGHIPSALHSNWEKVLQEDGTLKPPEELQEMLSNEGFDPNKDTIAYCQSGARSGHQYLVFHLMGYDNVKNYDGSWKEWGDSDRPRAILPWG